MTAKHGDTKHHHRQPPRKAPHKDWRLWIAVVLMLAAMAAYVSWPVDEPLPPDGPQFPAAEDADVE